MKVAEVIYDINDHIKHNEYCLISSKLLESLLVSSQVLVQTKEGEKVGLVKKIMEFDENELSLVNSTIVRTLSEKDLKQIRVNEKDSMLALSFAKAQAKQLGLLMSFVDAFYTFDRKQLYLTYTADDRVDLWG